jgi:hypothetical protein
VLKVTLPVASTVPLRKVRSVAASMTVDDLPSAPILRSLN